MHFLRHCPRYVVKIGGKIGGNRSVFQLFALSEQIFVAQIGVSAC